MAREKKNNRRSKGDGTVYQLKSGMWRAQATVGYKKNGNPKKVTRSAKTKSEALALLRQITIQYGSGQINVDGGITLKEYIPRYFETKKATLKIKTRTDYESIFRTSIIPALGHITLNKLTTAHINKFIKDDIESGESPNTVRKHKTILSGVLKNAVAEGLIYMNPVIYSNSVPKSKSKSKFISSEDMVKILAEAERIAGKAYTKSGGQSYVAYAVLLTAYHTGLRIGEVFGLRWKNIDLKEQIIHVVADVVEAKNEVGKYTLTTDDTKSASTIRYIKISHKLCEVLANLRSKNTLPSDIVFKTSTDNYISPNNFRRVWRKILKNIGMEGKYKIHEFRHTHVSELHARGFNPIDIQRRLGHANMQTTIIYTHSIHNNDERMAEIFDEEIPKDDK